ncbi:MAG: putative Ig domain-containing protein, partial [Candidatus Zixiibacteriota bacterium]
YVLILMIAVLIASMPNRCIRAADSDLSDSLAWREYIRSIPVTQWPEIDGGKPVTYDEWQARTGPVGPFTISLAESHRTPLSKDGSTLFYVIVNASLFPSITSSISQYVTDLNNDGYDVEVHATLGGTPQDLKAFLQSGYSSGMAGCILIGDLPVPWYETTCWDSYDAFPVDLYYMDLDGTWEDADENGLFDSHFGDKTPEIYVGRLTASPMTLGGADEVSLVEHYFYKNHNYRTGQDLLMNRALVYVDDDWIPWAYTWSDNVGLAYNTRTLVSEGATTVDLDYEIRLAWNYESVLLCAHSSPSCHFFKIGEDWTGGTTCNDEVKDIDPVAHFYNLFACSNARYVEYDYMAGWYIFCESHGVASLGSTKTGSMLSFEYFYGPFGAGKTIGESFADWFTSVGAYGFPQEDLCWFYGMTLCGDPTLKHLESEPPHVVTTSLADGEYNKPYSAALEAAGGVMPYTWQISAGTLPDNLQLDPPTGVISGAPLSVGRSDFTVMVSDANVPPLTGFQSLSITITFLCGDVNNDGLVNLLDISYLISYLYREGGEPLPPEAADANGDYNTSLLDVTHLVSYLYRDGPGPACP